MFGLRSTALVLLHALFLACPLHTSTSLPCQSSANYALTSSHRRLSITSRVLYATSLSHPSLYTRGRPLLHVLQGHTTAAIVATTDHDRCCYCDRYRCHYRSRHVSRTIALLLRSFDLRLVLCSVQIRLSSMARGSQRSFDLEKSCR